MARYEYKIIVNRFPFNISTPPLSARGITVHHDAVAGKGDPLSKLDAFARMHNHMPYSIYIPKENDVIYITQTADRSTWHNGSSLNSSTFAICVGGYFWPAHSEKPTTSQLKRLKQVLDDFHLASKGKGYFVENNFKPQYRNVNPRDNKTRLRTNSGKSVHVLHGHKEVSATACPGTLMTYIEKYRNGDYNMGLTKPKPPAGKTYSEAEYNKLKSKLEEKQRELRDTRAKYDKSIENLNLKIDNKDTQIETLEGDLENSVKYVEKLEQKNKKLIEDISILEKKIDELSQDNNFIDFKRYLDYLETNKYQIFLVGLGWLISFLTSSELTQNVTWVGSIIVVLQQIQSWAIAAKKKKSPVGL
jgi:hypothetical protein